MSTQPVYRTPLQRRVDDIVDDARRAAQEAREAAARTVDADARLRAMRELREAVIAAVGVWRRPCFICASGSWCGHREPELIERWEKGRLR